MSRDGRPLLAAICANPDDDNPRLIYADWIDENGQPERAEFIRLQCEEARLDPSDARLATVRNRSSQLLKVYRDQWYDELPLLEGVEWGSLFVRGFIDVLQTERIIDFRLTLERAFAATPLRYLYVTRLMRGQLRQLLNFPLLDRLLKLSLPGTMGRAESRLLTDARLRFPNTEIS